MQSIRETTISNNLASKHTGLLYHSLITIPVGGVLAMSLEENKARVRLYVEEAWNKGNVDIIDELMTLDYARLPTGSMQLLNRDGQKQRIQAFRQTFPDLLFTVEDLIAEGDRVAFHLQGHATHKGIFIGIAPTDRHVTIHAFDIVRFVDDKIAEHLGGPDLYHLQQQLTETVSQS